MRTDSVTEYKVGDAVSFEDNEGAIRIGKVLSHVCCSVVRTGKEMFLILDSDLRKVDMDPGTLSRCMRIIRRWFVESCTDDSMVGYAMSTHRAPEFYEFMEVVGLTSHRFTGEYEGVVYVECQVVSGDIILFCWAVSHPVELYKLPRRDKPELLHEPTAYRRISDDGYISTCVACYKEKYGVA